VTLEGVGGVRIGMDAKRVAALLDAPVVAVSDQESSAWAYVPICSGGMAGVATFFGPDQTLSDPTANGLESIWFSAGAKTRRGVGIGSTRAQVGSAYGADLHHDSTKGSNLYIIGQRVPFVQNVYVRPIIYFLFEHNKVVEIGYGARQPTLEQVLYGVSAATATC
jgi:hypothetical protein